MGSIDLTLAEEALGAIARKAIDPKTGARGLRSIMEGILLDTMFDLPSLEGVEEVVISKEVVEGTARPLYIYADRADRAGDASASEAEPCRAPPARRDIQPRLDPGKHCRCAERTQDESGSARSGIIWGMSVNNFSLTQGATRRMTCTRQYGARWGRRDLLWL
jgi:hypothetical protein